MPNTRSKRSRSPSVPPFLLDERGDPYLSIYRHADAYCELWGMCPNRDDFVSREDCAFGVFTIQSLTQPDSPLRIIGLDVRSRIDREINAYSNAHFPPRETVLQWVKDAFSLQHHRRSVRPCEPRIPFSKGLGMFLATSPKMEKLFRKDAHEILYYDTEANPHHLNPEQIKGVSASKEAVMRYIQSLPSEPRAKNLLLLSARQRLQIDPTCVPGFSNEHVYENWMNRHWQHKNHGWFFATATPVFSSLPQISFDRS